MQAVDQQPALAGRRLKVVGHRANQSVQAPQVRLPRVLGLCDQA